MVLAGSPLYVADVINHRADELRDFRDSSGASRANVVVGKSGERFGGCIKERIGSQARDRGVRLELLDR